MNKSCDLFSQKRNKRLGKIALEDRAGNVVFGVKKGMESKGIVTSEQEVRVRLEEYRVEHLEIIRQLKNLREQHAECRRKEEKEEARERAEGAGRLFLTNGTDLFLITRQALSS